MLLIGPTYQLPNEVISSQFANTLVDEQVVKRWVQLKGAPMKLKHCACVAIIFYELGTLIEILKKRKYVVGKKKDIINSLL
jgi:hypothetical protein